MKLRKLPARDPALIKKRKNTEDKISVRDPKTQKEPESDPEEDVTFEEILPFSPPNIGQDRDAFMGDDTDSGSDQSDQNDEEWIMPDRVVLERKRPQSSKSKKEQNGEENAKKFSEDEVDAEVDCENDIKLEFIIDDDEQFDHVKSVLDRLPAQFGKEYCKYLIAQKSKGVSASGNASRIRSQKAPCTSKESTSTRQCIICNKVMKNRKIREHLEQHSSPEGYRCICDKIFKTCKSFSEHVLVKHKKVVKCPDCNLNFQGVSLLKAHSKKAHPQLICTICEKKFPQKWKLLEHINIHTGLLPHKCSQCQKAYRVSASLKEHMNLQHSNKQFKCPICEKTFTSQKYLNFHAQVHGDRKYECKVCGESFKTAPNLKHHEAHHGTDKCFTCNDCDSTFTTKSSLRKHRQLHCSAKRVKRVQCPKTEEDGEVDDVANCINDNKTDSDHENDKNDTLNEESNFAMLDSSEIALNSRPLMLDKPLFSGIDIENDSENDSEDDE